MLNGALFNVDYSEMVIVRDIDFYSLCEHHLLPFFGKCHVAYIPNGRVIGLSKLPRLVDIFARRLQLQERMTNQIAETIRTKINPLGVAVVCEGTHLCMAMRGVEKQNSYTITSAMLGGVPRQRAHAHGVSRAAETQGPGLVARLARSHRCGVPRRIAEAPTVPCRDRYTGRRDGFQ